MDTQKSPQKPQKTQISPVSALALVMFGLVLLNLLFISLIGNEAQTVKLLKQELNTLEKENQIIDSAQEIYASYDREIALISDVFPNEETVVVTITELENVIRPYANQYALKFASDVPLKEGDLLFLPFTITMTTDMLRLSQFFESLENLHYMTHITSVSSKNPSGFLGESEVQVGFKLYVQNPFTTK
ncbi:hypothetical protein C4579_02290 [Candidatus Microgenomates bacterium]|nr:MAG: hypothetical protein C4579_02290 [Candidatus Microgenomates bacterium]